ncbi:unnamed protein product [Symbiodinium sp. CCMP2456]|nr:unnamed protein product [Symbiodinium sp. CCMP2456]
MPPERIGSVRVLSCSTTAKLLPSVEDGGESSVLSFYIRSDVESLTLSAEHGIVGDCRATPSHQTRQRDILFSHPQQLREVGNIPTNKTLQAGSAEKPCDIGQNVTLAVDDPCVSTWCVGDLIQLGAPGNAALIRVTSTRRPCPKNSNVHGEGTQQHMQRHGLGGVFGMIVRDGTVRLQDAVVLAERLQSKWTCVQVHIALYGCTAERTAPSELHEIIGLGYLEEPRYKDVAKKRLKEMEATASGSRWQWEPIVLLVLSVIVVQVYRHCNSRRG